MWGRSVDVGRGRSISTLEESKKHFDEWNILVHKKAYWTSCWSDNTVLIILLMVKLMARGVDGYPAANDEELWMIFYV